MLAFRKNLHRGPAAGGTRGSPDPVPTPVPTHSPGGDARAKANGSTDVVGTAADTGVVDAGASLPGTLPEGSVGASTQSYESAFAEAQEAYEAEAQRLAGDADGFTQADRETLAGKYDPIFREIYDTATEEERGRYEVTTTSDLQTIAEYKQAKNPVATFDEKQGRRWQPSTQSRRLPDGTSETLYTTKGTSVEGALEFDNETGKFKAAAKNPRALTEAEVLGFVRTQVAGYDRMGEEQQRQIFEYVRNNGGSGPDDFLGQINDLYAGEIDFPQELYSPTQEAGSYGQTGPVDDQSDVFVLNRAFEGVEESVREDAMARYVELRKGWTPEQRWNFARNCTDPQVIIDSKPAKDGEGTPLKQTDVFKRGREAVKAYGEDVTHAYQDAADAVTAEGDRVESRLSEDSVQEQVALEQAIPLTEARRKEARDRASDAAAYRTYYDETIKPLENARDVLLGGVEGQQTVLKNKTADLEAAKAQADAALAELSALPDDQFGGADKKKAYTDALTNLRAAYASGEQTQIDAATAAMVALGDAPAGSQAAFAKARGALADEHDALLAKNTAQTSYDDAAKKAVGEDGRSLADIEAELRGLAAERTKKRGALTSEDVAALEGTTADDYIKGLDAMDGIIGEELQAQKDRMAELEAETHYFEEREAYDQKRDDFERLVSDMESFHLQDVQEGIKKLTGEKVPVGLDDLTPEGLKKRDAIVKDQRDRLGASIDHAQKLALDEPAEWIGAGAKLVGDVKSGVQAAKELADLMDGTGDARFKAIYERIGARMGKMADEINTKNGARRGNLLTDFEKLKNLYKKSETQSANQKAAHDRAFGEKSTAAARKEARVGVGHVDSKEAQAEQALASARKEDAETTKKNMGKDARYYTGQIWA